MPAEYSERKSETKGKPVEQKSIHEKGEKLGEKVKETPESKFNNLSNKLQKSLYVNVTPDLWKKIGGKGEFPKNSFIVMSSYVREGKKEITFSIKQDNLISSVKSLQNITLVNSPKEGFFLKEATNGHFGILIDVAKQMVGVEDEPTKLTSIEADQILNVLGDRFNQTSQQKSIERKNAIKKQMDLAQQSDKQDADDLIKGIESGSLA